LKLVGVVETPRCLVPFAIDQTTDVVPSFLFNTRHETLPDPTPTTA